MRFEEGTTRLLFDVKESSSLVASNPTMKADAAVSGDDFEKATSSATEIHETKVPNETIAKRRAVDSKARKSKRGILGGVSCHLDVRVKGALATAFVWLPIIPLMFWLRGIVRKQSGLQNGKKKKTRKTTRKARRQPSKTLPAWMKRNRNSTNSFKC